MCYTHEYMLYLGHMSSSDHFQVYISIKVVARTSGFVELQSIYEKQKHIQSQVAE